MAKRPDEDTFKYLLDYKIATIRDNKYIYSTEFEKSVEEIGKHPPSRLTQARLAHEVESKLTHVLISRAIQMKSRRDIEDMIIAYCCIKSHLGRLKMNMPDEYTLPFVVYGTFYLNNHEPVVGEQE